MPTTCQWPADTCYVPRLRVAAGITRGFRPRSRATFVRPVDALTIRPPPGYPGGVRLADRGRKADSRRTPGSPFMASLSPPLPPTARTRVSALRDALATRVVVADGAMGTMLQAQEPTLEDFENLEGCNEILNVTRPDIVRSVHEEYFAAGVDCVETNTFGANHRRWPSTTSPSGCTSCPRPAPASPARPPTTSPPRRPPALGAGLDRPGHQAAHPRPHRLPTLRDGLQANAEGLIAGGADALIVETTQDLLQTKAAVVGARRALEAPASTCRCSSRWPSRRRARCCWARRSVPR